MEISISWAFLGIAHPQQLEKAMKVFLWNASMKAFIVTISILTLYNNNNKTNTERNNKKNNNSDNNDNDDNNNHSSSKIDNSNKNN